MEVSKRALFVLLLLSYGCHMRPAPEEGEWRVEADKIIEEFRKGELVLQLIDRTGSPARQIDVEVKLVKHHFEFGTAVDASTYLSATSDGERYRQAFEENFNAATLENDLKMQAWYGDWSGFSQDQTVRALKKLKEAGVYSRGHVLIWPSREHLSAQFKRLRGNNLRDKIRAHVLAMVRETKGLVQDWDVVNEPYRHNELIEELGANEISHWFMLASSSNPDVKLFVNDYRNLEDSNVTQNERYLFSLIQYLKESGRPIHGIGLQAHLNSKTLPSLERVKEKLDRFAKLGLPIKITELDIRGSEQNPYYFRDLITLCFGHPAVRGIYLWGFWAGKKWVPEFAFYDKEWNTTEYYREFRKLRNKWSTDIKARTDGAGTLVTRAFFGTYRLRIASPSGVITRDFEFTPDASGTVQHVFLR